MIPHKHLVTGVLFALAALAACTPAGEPPTPTLIVLGQSFPTTTPMPTIIPLPTQTPLVLYTATPTIEPPPTRTPTPTPTASLTPRPSAIPGAGLVGIGCQGNFSASSLLVNGDFEGGEHAQEVDSVQVPDGWTAFWRPVGSPVTYDPLNTEGYQRPEMSIIPKQPPYTDPARIAQGNQAFMLSGGLRVFDAGIFQVVTVNPGDSLCLTGLGQAWSSHVSDDPFSSTLLSGDDQRNANVQLGIDLQGGSDPFAASVQWGNAEHLYDKFAALDVVQISASGPSVTVFVRGYVLWRFAHNELFFDAISLVKQAS
jgi:hypothetical protein